MAIIFTAVRYRRLTEAAGTPGDLGYIGRRAIFDRRLGKQIDFSRFADDLVYDHLWLPDDAPPEFGNVEYFANAVDAAEMARIRSNLDDLSRKPQTGTAMITALPSDREITLDESQELAWRIVSVVRQGYRLPIHLAIHEPALKLRGALNRHAHAFIVGRELEPFGFALTKLRKDTAAIRTQGGSSFVADAIHWPDKTWEIVRTALLELGTDLVVDLIAPLPQAHLTMSRSGRTPGKIGLYRALLKDGNLAAIQGTPCDLLAKLLRGRSQIEIKELRGMVAKFIDAQADRDAAVDRILANNDIVTLADTANPRTPRFVTTAAAHSAIEYAVDLVDRSKQGSGMIHAAVGNGHAAVVAAIHDVLDDNSLTLSEGGLLIIGNRRSDCDEMSASFEAAKPEVAPVAAVLARRSAKAGQRSRPEFPAKGLVIIPRAEHIRDQDLASLLELAENFETQVVLGKDLTQESGIVANRLASYAADRLTSRRSLSKHVVSAEQLLRAGLTTAAIGRMADHLSFASLKRPVANPDRFDFVVCTNGNAVRAADKKLASIYGQTCVGDGNSSFTVDLARGPAELWPGQPVVFTRTDYSELPPRIREGQLATIVSINRQKSTLRVELPDGTTALIKTKKFPWFRSAFALSIREARQLKGLAKLRIELGDARCAWAALILAAMQTLPCLLLLILLSRAACLPLPAC